MTFIYQGQRETGLEIARRIYESVALTSRHSVEAALPD